ncbi:MAG: M20/M25/M40 family metallo-hydrolase [Deltaproteobacteria bacterium]|nr:M20/M25/M40 family metallo-hydrolase [Deltaproteobacteria bacterium]
MYDLLKNKLEGLESELVGFAQALVREPSPSGDEAKVAALVAGQMRALGFDQVTIDDLGNVVGVLHGIEDGPTLLLASHMDTVGAGNLAIWNESPCSGRIEGGRLHGLGAADCKGGLAAQVFAAGLLKRSLLPLRGNLVVAATVLEENGISIGTRGLIAHTLEQMGLRPGYAILGEPTDLGLYYGHEGRAELQVTLRGLNPFRVTDAAELVTRSLDEFGKDGAVEEIAVGAIRYEDGPDFRQAVIALERRLGANDDPGHLVARTRGEAVRAASAAGGVDVEVAVRERNQVLRSGLLVKAKRITRAWSTDPFCPLLGRARQALGAAGCEVRPGRWALTRLGMGTSGSLLVNECSIPTIGYGPGHEEQAHREGESVPVAKLVACAYGTAAIAHGLVGVPVFGWIPDEL